VNYPDDEITYDIDNKVYILANSINSSKINELNYYGYNLNEGDIIKIGRYKVKIRKINLIDINNKINENISNKNKNNDKSYDNIQSKDSNNKIIINNNVENNCKNIDPDKQCRICFSNDEKISPLISPCSCIGSSKYIHLLCLQKWLQSKIKLEYKEKNNNLISAYRYQPAQCEICKDYMPDFIKKNSNLYEICDYHSNDEERNKNYFTLETIGSLKNHEKFIFHVIIKSENPISMINIGRSEECDIELNDNTISRFHSVITVRNNKIYIKDMSSKFGTGILLQNKNLQICNENLISLQLGRSILTFYQTLKSKSFCLCFNKKKNIVNNEIVDEEFYISENKKCINFENGYIIKENDY
jgi:pSer/pThr/pTyr-binding forkhead associated (FHA) protein